MVDLDTDQQGVSTIFGLQVRIGLPSGGVIAGEMTPTGLNGLWTNVMPTVSWIGYGGDTFMSASFQSVLKVPVGGWPANSGSAVVDQLRAVCDTVADESLLVSLKFVLDAFVDDSINPNFRIGRITGTLGPGKASEPLRCPNRRWLRPRHQPTDAKTGQITTPWNDPAFNGGPFSLDETRRVLVIDLGNSIPLASVAGPSWPIGSLQAVVLAKDGTQQVVGEVDYSQMARAATAGIVEVPLTAEQASLLSSQPLLLVASQITQGKPVVMAERLDGLAFAVDNRVFRMAPDTPSWQGVDYTRQETWAYVTQWGKPKAGIAFGAESTPTMAPSSPGYTDQNKGLPPSQALAITVATSDDQGRAAVCLEAKADPGSRSAQLDGMQYIFQLTPESPTGSTPDDPALGTFDDPEQEIQVSVHLYASYPVLDTPTWNEIQPIFVPYMKLYPAMREKIDLTVEDTFLFYANMPPNNPPGQGILTQMMQLPFDDPDFMPVTRDLSPNKTQTVLNFIAYTAKQGQTGRQTQMA